MLSASCGAGGASRRGGGQRHGARPRRTTTHEHGHDARARPRTRTTHAHEPPTHEPAHARARAGEHSHGGVRHSHLPPTGSTITWRSLFVLGLAGGLIPSTSALLILLGSIAAGRPAFGFVLVVAFGLGHGAVMGGIGLAMVFARGRLERVDSASPLGRASATSPLAAVRPRLSLGLYLTAQAVGGDRPVVLLSRAPRPIAANTASDRMPVVATLC